MIYFFIAASALVLLDMLVTYLSYRSTEKQISDLYCKILAINAYIEVEREKRFKMPKCNCATKMREYKADILVRQDKLKEDFDRAILYAKSAVTETERLYKIQYEEMKHFTSFYKEAIDNLKNKNG